MFLTSWLLVLEAGIEPARTQCPQDFKSCVSTDSTIRASLVERAKNGTRTRDPDLGKVVLYQLSYFRVLLITKAIFAYERTPDFFGGCKYKAFFILYKHLIKNNWIIIAIFVVCLNGEKGVPLLSGRVFFGTENGKD